MKNTLKKINVANSWGFETITKIKKRDQRSNRKEGKYT